MYSIISTGDIAFRILDELKEKNENNPDEETFGHVTCCDINKSMLDVGEDRGQKVNIFRTRVFLYSCEKTAYI